MDPVSTLKPKTNCPNCGAPVKFLYANAVQAACEFCKSILVRHDLDLDRVGQVAEIPQDSSPIQILTEGVYANKAFQVVGRIVYEYEQGSWNEWHILFTDGASAWLSDAQAQYAVSQLMATPPPLAPESDVKVGDRFQWQGRVYQATTKTLAKYVGFEGNLPFEYWGKEQMMFVDLRTHDAHFATIDYSETPPLLFLGEMVDFDALKLRNLREFEGW